MKRKIERKKFRSIDDGFWLHDNRKMAPEQLQTIRREDISVQCTIQYNVDSRTKGEVTRHKTKDTLQITV